MKGVDDQTEIKMGGLYLRARSIDSLEEYKSFVEKVEAIEEVDEETLYKIIYAGFLGLEKESRREHFFNEYSPSYLDECVGEWVLSRYQTYREFTRRINRMIRDNEFP